MDIFRLLKNNPDQALQIDDDKLALKFMRDNGIGDAFLDASSLADRPTVQICGYDGIETHFVLTFLFSGCLPANENGHQVSFVPRIAFEPGLTAGDFAVSASSGPKFKGLRVINLTAKNQN